MQEILHKNLKENLKVLDHTVTKEQFTLYKNEEYDLMITYPKPKDLDKYYESEDYISHTDSNKSLIDKLYKTVRNYTLNNKLKLINSFNTEEKTLLDIGCGTGDFLLNCKKNNWTTIGVEPNEKARNISITKHLDIKENISQLENLKFDVITLWHVLEHVPNLDEYIKILKTLLKDNGVLIIAVPNHKSYDAKYYKQYWAAYDVPRHLWHFSKTSIKKIFETENIVLEKTLPMKFDSYYVSILSEKYKKGKTNLLKAFYIGLTSNLKAMRSKEYSSHIYILKKS